MEGGQKVLSRQKGAKKFNQMDLIFVLRVY